MEIEINDLPLEKLKSKKEYWDNLIISLSIAPAMFFIAAIVCFFGSAFIILSAMSGKKVIKELDQGDKKFFLINGYLIFAGIAIYWIASLIRCFYPHGLIH